MAGHAVSHVQGAYLHYLAHRLHISMAGGAGKASADMGLMEETDVIRHPVRALPIDRLLLHPGLPELPELLRRLGDGALLGLKLRLRDDLVAEHALLNIGKTGGPGRRHGPVAEGAIDPRCLGVNRMVEVDGFVGRRMRDCSKQSRNGDGEKEDQARDPDHREPDEDQAAQIG